MFEINLVPDIKAELLHRQRMRNFVIFISILVAVGAVTVVALIASVVGGQMLRIGAQDAEIACLSDGQKGVDGCSEDGIMLTPSINQYLTVQDQLTRISGLNTDKAQLSRLFGVLDVILPYDPNNVVVTISELSVNLGEATLSFEAQGDDNKTKIDYTALEAFKNIVALSMYDYGRYMDSEGSVIPTMCIQESGDGGAPYVNAKGQSYAIYTKGIPGCGLPMVGGLEEGAEPVAQENIEIVRDMTQDELEGAIANGEPYFASECITFDGDGKKANSCMLATGPAAIRGSSNGRDSGSNLVLRFSTTVSVAPEVFSFSSKHMRIIGPTRQNVTDSYLQIRNMFTERAQDCAPEDTECNTNVENING